MELGNIEKSELVIATVLRILIERGLRAGSLEFKQLGLSDEYRPFFATSFSWLQSEGFVRAVRVTVIPDDEDETHDDLLVYNPALTAYGFSRLGQSVKIGETTTTLREAVDTRTSGKPSAWQIGDFVGGILGGTIKSVSS